MPNLSNGVVLLNFTVELAKNRHVEDAPWVWPAWQARVGTTMAPWHPHGPDVPHIFCWDESQIAQATAYIKHFETIATWSKREEFSRPKKDNEAAGRKLVNTALCHAWDRIWHVGDVIRQALKDFDKDYVTLVAEHGEKKVGQYTYV